MRETKGCEGGVSIVGRSEQETGQKMQRKTSMKERERERIRGKEREQREKEY